jgi:hypothetical protein
MTVFDLREQKTVVDGGITRIQVGTNEITIHVSSGYLIIFDQYDTDELRSKLMASKGDK